MAFRPQMPPSARLAWVVLAVVLAVPIGWGIHAYYPWDVDHIAPGSVLKAMAAYFGPGWHSSYGPLPYFVTALVYAPLLALMRLVGDLGQPSETYPWGFARPEQAIAILVVAARLVSLAFALGVAWLASRDAAPRQPGAAPAPRAPAWLMAVLLAGSATFVFYARTSNVDMAALFWAWLAFALVESRPGSMARYAGAAAAAAGAVCCKEQIAPFAAVAGLAACARAWWLPVGAGYRAGVGATGVRTRGLAGAALVALAGLATYALLWGLPWNASGWLAHHHFLFGTAKYGRTYAATAAGYAGLGGALLALTPVAFGLPVILGLLVAPFTRPRLGGLGLRALASALYLAGFLGSIGYVYARFLLPLLLLAVPVAARGLETAWGRTGPRGRAALAAALLALGLLGGPALDVMMLNDPRYRVERWLATAVPAGGTVEVAGNPRFQARVPHALALRVTSPDSLRVRPRGPEGDVVLTSSLDWYAFEREPRAAAYAAALGPAGGYRLALLAPPGPFARLMRRLPVAPEIRVYVRERAGVERGTPAP